MENFWVTSFEKFVNLSFNFERKLIMELLFLIVLILDLT